METNKKHWTTKLKEENAQLQNDIYAILDGDFQITLQYQMLRNAKMNFEKLIWGGK